jgi:CRISPR-associated RAMP protein (TIGR02581 family)
MSFYQFESRLKLEGSLEAKTALRIGAGRSTSPTALDLPVVKDAFGRPYIPGSSLKGVLRSTVESLVRAMAGDDPGFACNPTSNNDWCIPVQGVGGREDINTIKKRNRGQDAALTKELLENTCLVCQLFGSPWVASRLQVRDLAVDQDTWFGQFQERNGVAIDRDKEVAAEGKLYDFEVVPAGVRFRFSAIVENGDTWQLGMLWAGLRAFEEGDIAIGGATSRGLGVVVLNLTTKTYVRPDGTDALLDVLISGKGGDSVGKELIQQWQSDFRAELLKKLNERARNAQKDR